MKIGIDLDNTITAYPEFFTLFTQAVKQIGCQIHIITNREQGTENNISDELKTLRIVFDVIKITGNKSKYIIEQGISVFCDDTDEYFLELPETVAVLKIREAGNFDFERGKWIA